MPPAAPTPRQQDYLDYIAAYTHAHRCAPAEADMQRHFDVTAPSVHTMVLTLERRGFIRRVPGQARSITLVPLTTASPPASSPLAPSSAETTMPAPSKKSGWSSISPLLVTWEKSALLALVKDLYAVSEAARDLVTTRCRPVETGAAILEKARRKIVEQFYPDRGFGKLKLGEARKAIRDFRKVTGDIAGTAELLLTYVENGTRFTQEYGDIDERFYNSIESALNELVRLLHGPARPLYPEFQSRLDQVEIMSRNIGWGFHDFIAGTVASLEEDLAVG